MQALYLSSKKIKEGTFLMEHSKDTGHSVKKKGAEDRVPVDVDRMLEGLRKKIVDIYKREIGQGEVSGKATIALLNVSVLKSYLIVKISRKSKSDATRAWKPWKTCIHLTKIKQ